MDSNFHKEFIKCPACGSEDRFMEQLGREIKDRGLARPEWNMSWDFRQGVVVDQAKAKSIPIGSELPGYVITTDICMNCGCVYATNLTRVSGKIGIAPPQPILPNRADRRRLEKLGGNFSSPLLS
mgnify:CR=1 FL=1